MFLLHHGLHTWSGEGLYEWNCLLARSGSFVLPRPLPSKLVVHFGWVLCMDNIWILFVMDNTDADTLSGIFCIVVSMHIHVCYINCRQPYKVIFPPVTVGSYVKSFGWLCIINSGCFVCDIIIWFPILLSFKYNVYIVGGILECLGPNVFRVFAMGFRLGFSVIEMYR